MENMSAETYNVTGNKSDYMYTFYDDYSLELPEPYGTIVLVLHWIVLVMIFASVFGNVFIIIIMSLPKNRDTSTSVFFVALAISDMFLMVFVALERWLIGVKGTVLFGTDQTMARIRAIAENSSVQISSWILCMITLERVICLIVPHRFKQICTVRNAVLVVVLTYGMAFAFNIVCVSTMIDVVYIDNFHLYTDRIDGGLSIFSWLDFILGFCLPFVIIFVGTIIITSRLFRLKGKDLKSNRKSILQTLVAVNVVFLVTMIPFRVLYIIYPDAAPTDMPMELFVMYHEIVISLADLNSTLNFYIYILSGKRFRADIKRLFCC